jgi:hypothetical protein
MPSQVAERTKRLFSSIPLIVVFLKSAGMRGSFPL